MLSKRLCTRYCWKNFVCRRSGWWSWTEDRTEMRLPSQFQQEKVDLLLRIVTVPEICYCARDLCVAACCSVLQCVAVCCSVLQCVAVCCSVLQCVAVCCSVLQWDAVVAVFILRNQEKLASRHAFSPCPVFEGILQKCLRGHSRMYSHIYYYRVCSKCLRGLQEWILQSV